MSHLPRVPLLRFARSSSPTLAMRWDLRRAKPDPERHSWRRVAIGFSSQPPVRIPIDERSRSRARFRPTWLALPFVAFFLSAGGLAAQILPVPIDVAADSKKESGSGSASESTTLTTPAAIESALTQVESRLG